MLRDREQLDALIGRVALYMSVPSAERDMPALQAALDAYQRWVNAPEPVRRARRLAAQEVVDPGRDLPGVEGDMSETTEDSAMHDTEMTAAERQQATFDKEKAECDRFVAEYGGEYNSGGTRHRVVLYYEDMRRIAEMCRWYRDTAIGESTGVDEDP
jgi:hypothetical protein